MSSGGGSTTSNSVSTPWTGQQPSLQNMFGQANSVYNQFSGDPQSSVAGFTPMQYQAMGLQQNQGANGANLSGSADCRQR